MLARLNESAGPQDLPYPTLIVNDTRLATIDVCGASFGSKQFDDTTDKPFAGVDFKKDTIISLESSDERKSTKMRDSDDPIPLEAFKLTDIDSSMQQLTPWPQGWVGGSTPSALADNSSCAGPASIPKTMPAAQK